MKQGECKLCGQYTELVTKSHIFPTFMYKGVFDDSNRTLLADIRKANSTKLYQTGFYDKDILCQYCENVVLGKSERYVSTILNADIADKSITKTETKENDVMSILELKNLDYKLFKLFVLGLLWKAHISNNSFFKRVDIPSHEPVIRKMLLEEDPGPEALYEIALVRLDRVDNSIVDIIPTPEAKEGQAINIASFILGGYVFTVSLQENSGFKLFPSFSLKASNEIRICRLKGGAARAYLKAMGIPDDFANYFSGTKKSAF